MIAELSLPLSTEGDIRHLAGLWQRSVDATCTVLVERGLVEVQRDGKIYDPLERRPEKQGCSSLNNIRMTLWLPDEEQIIKMAGRRRTSTGQISRTAVRLLAQGLKRLSTDDPVIKRWAAANRALKVGIVRAAIICNSAGIPRVPRDERGYRQGSPVPEGNLIKCVAHGAVRFAIYPADDQKSRLLELSEAMKLPVVAVVRVAVHLGLEGT